MDMYEDMQKDIKDFCNSYPPEGFELNYLENAKEIYELYAEASTILNELNESIDRNRLEDIRAKIKKLAN